MKLQLSNSSGDLRKLQEDLNALKVEHELHLRKADNFMKEKDLPRRPRKSHQKWKQSAWITKRTCVHQISQPTKFIIKDNSLTTYLIYTLFSLKKVSFMPMNKP